MNIEQLMFHINFDKNIIIVLYQDYLTTKWREWLKIIENISNFTVTIY